MSNPVHPKCGKTYPGGSSAGHCSGCCETFIGLVSFEAHRIGQHGVDRRCQIQPYTSYGKEYPHTIRFGHWEDERGFWHYGERMTDEQKAALYGKAEATDSQQQETP